VHRLATVLRDIARGGLAGLIAGIVVGGVGGRIVMSIAAIINPNATGLFTENGEVIGRFTLQGTLALITFGGLGASALGAVVWVIVSPWVPGLGARRALLMAPIAVTIGSFPLNESTNSDFLIPGPRPVILALPAALGSRSCQMPSAQNVATRAPPAGLPCTAPPAHTGLLFAHGGHGPRM